jgi:thymidylate synthase ThyX
MVSLHKMEVNLLGGRVFVVDGMLPEDVAMLQALYSRSAESVEVHLAKVDAKSSAKFFDKYVVGYGHKSIADCGSTTVFIENVSTLAAKAFENWPLYAGQETSTRYIDMASRRIVDPVGTPASKRVLERWMEFYVSSQAEVGRTLRTRYPRREGEKEEVYDRAIKARTFDILRGFLPAGITTQLSWHTNLRQAGDHLTGLVHHPLAEVRQVAMHVNGLLHKCYPSSGFGPGPSMAGVSGVSDKLSGTSEKDAQALARIAEREAWEVDVARRFAYPGAVGSGCRRAHLGSVPAKWGEGAHSGREHCDTCHPLYEPRLRTTIDAQRLAWYNGVLQSRPRGCVLPPCFTALGQVSMTFLLDFGSFRDIQRHRNGACPMPLLTPKYEFESWYVANLGLELSSKAMNLIKEQEEAILALDTDDVERQNYWALGYRVPVQVVYPLQAAVYVLELRSTKVVHPTLRRQMHAIVKLFQKDYVLSRVPLHVDLDPDDWDVRRGAQTITEREGR